MTDMLEGGKYPSAAAALAAKLAPQVLKSTPPRTVLAVVRNAYPDAPREMVEDLVDDFYRGVGELVHWPKAVW